MAQNKEDSPHPLSMDSLFRMKAKESIGKDFPSFTATFGSLVINNDALKGKIVFINFWFEACPPCIAELPSLNKLYDTFCRNKNFEFLSFTYESPGKISLLKKKYGLRYKVASVSSQECYRLNQNNGFPTSIILNREGKIIHLYTGGDEDRKKSAQFIATEVYNDIQEALTQ
ncbi:MAG: TlpA family protein disulfide reductase [Bacteroidetes bacterium]|jgi:peroxiredoxin|nr:TlpA family protein disulfide reductase [Bacteroidota bacterium]